MFACRLAIHLPDVIPVGCYWILHISTAGTWDSCVPSYRPRAGKHFRVFMCHAFCIYGTCIIFIYYGLPFLLAVWHQHYLRSQACHIFSASLLNNFCTVPPLSTFKNTLSWLLSAVVLLMGEWEWIFLLAYLFVCRCVRVVNEWNFGIKSINMLDYALLNMWESSK